MDTGVAQAMCVAFLISESNEFHSEYFLLERFVLKFFAQTNRIPKINVHL
jgi:hypothetical protein